MMRRYTHLFVPRALSHVSISTLQVNFHKKLIDVDTSQGILGKSMVENLLRRKDLPTEILNALQVQEQIQEDHGDLPMYKLKISHKAANTALEWGLSPTIAVAVLLAPVLEYDSALITSISETHSKKAVELAEQFIRLDSSNIIIDDSSIGPSSIQWSILLRRLIRQAYLDLPNFSLILLLIVYHDAYLALGLKNTAEYTESVFVPLAQMLGLWELRRCWLEYSLSRLYPHEYEEIAKQIRGANPFDEEDIRGLLEEKPPARKLAHRKGRAYNRLKDRLTELFEKEGFDSKPDIRLIKPHIGVYLWNVKQPGSKEGRSIEKSLMRLSIKIQCKSIQDCYRVLGIVHSLGKPVAPSFVERTRDFIADPKPNGYQALHCNIVYHENASGEVGGEIPVSFCILTPEMHRLNEWGIVADVYGNSSSLSGKAWWNKLKENSFQFRQRQKRLEDSDLGTRSDPIYVFTEQGELSFPQDGSTALDFAYRIHTKLGDHAARIEVNGAAVPYNYPLHNGDLVYVHYDPNFLGPDLSWLGAVFTPPAIQHIRHKLIVRAHAIHKGRHKIEQKLIKLMQHYKEKKNYDLTISTAQLEAFLMSKAEELGLPNLDALYDRVDAGNLSPQDLAHEMVSNELSAMVVDENGNMLVYGWHRISLCNNCWPVPGEAIVGLEFEYRKSAMKGLKIHVNTDERCLKSARRDKLVSVRWLEQSNDENKHVLLFKIEAESRHRLLQSITSHIYEVPGISLNSIEGQAYSDGKARVSFVVEANTINHLINLQALLETVPGVRRVFASPPSPAQRLTLLSKKEEDRHQSNPYTYQEVSDPIMFYDREKPISRILGWLRQAIPTESLILHGQRRVGKTSLAKYLIRVILPLERQFQPVFVDFQKLNHFNAQGIAECLVRSVYEALDRAKDVPRLTSGEEPMFWLSHTLKEVAERLFNRRLLMILDEFNVLLDMEAEGRLDSMIFTNLRGVIYERRDLNWLLIVQDTHFRDPERFGSAGPLFQQSPTLQLTHLDPQYALKLITEPIHRARLQYANQIEQNEETIPSRILRLTDGNPFFIQVLCYELCRRVLDQGRSNITVFDLEHIVDLLTSPVDGPRLFDHFVKNLKGLQKILLIAIARCSGARGWTSLQELVVLIRQWCHGKEIHCEELDKNIEMLEYRGILARRDGVTPMEVNIPIKLFQIYVEDCMDLRQAVDEWKAGK